MRGGNVPDASVAGTLVRPARSETIELSRLVHGRLDHMVSSSPIDPAKLLSYLGDDASVLLNEYFHSGYYTGGQFERFAGGGDRNENAGRFTSDDIVALSLLGVRIPGRAALEILQTQPSRFNSLLNEVPGGVDLWDAPAESIGPDSAAEQLWQLLVTLPGIAWVTAGKLMARKRPRLIPIYDRVVKKSLARPATNDWWRPLRTALVENPELIARLRELRAEIGLDPEVSLLRVLDVSIWMRTDGEPEPTPDAET